MIGVREDGQYIEQDVNHASLRDTAEELIRKGRDVERRAVSRSRSGVQTLTCWRSAG